jgi:hypothetical protein
MVGRAAETARREDDRGRPLPTSDLMGYTPLGIIFGPLLLGDMLDSYTVRLANPHGGLVLLPVSHPKARKDRHKKSRTSDDCSAFNQHIDKIKIANSVTEMLVTHWRDVVRMVKDLKTPASLGINKPLTVRNSRKPILRPSTSEPFILRKPPIWNNDKVNQASRPISPTPAPAPQHNEKLIVRKQRSRLVPNQKTLVSRPFDVLTPTTEKQNSPGREGPFSLPKLKQSKSMNMLEPAKEKCSTLKRPKRFASQTLRSQKSPNLLSSTIHERSSADEVRILRYYGATGHI